jgi:hypothetical protein
VFRRLWRPPFIHWLDQTVFHHPGLEKGPDKFAPRLSVTRAATRAIQTAVIDSVEKFPEIQVNHDTVALSSVS